MKRVDEQASLVLVRDVLSSVKTQYILSGKEVIKKIDSGLKEAERIAEELNLMSIAYASQS